MDRVIRYRPEWRQLPWWNVVLVLGAPVVNTWRGVLSVPFFLGLVAAHVAVLAWVRMGTGVELRPDALVARGIRVRTVPWTDVTAIGPDKLLGEHCVQVRTRDTSFRLRAPRHWFLAPDPDFAAKAGMIYEYWIRHRGSDWRPPPATWPWPT